ncbi:MAG: hypothetical protein K2K54_02270 [Lachnospiraceae bacterium]|nr:hypothetical protein [Lachnospiraceae bacterium]
MKAKKVAAFLLSAAMGLSICACGNKNAGNTSADNVETTQESAAETPAEAESENAEAGNEGESTPAGEASIDFEDGLFAFVGSDKVVSPSSDNSVYSVEDYNGSKALKVTPQGGVVYVGFQMDALLGDQVSNLKTVEMTIGIENPDGEFQACSGNIYGMVGEENKKTNEAWSVYLETGNPKTASYTVPDDQTFGANNTIVVSLETDNGMNAGAAQANLYIDNIRFLDASGNVLTVDTSAEYVAASTSDDRANLYAVSGAVNFEGFACKGDGWAQDGFDMPQEIIDALVPGSVVEITYTSENGDMWLVMPDAAAGWMRVGNGDSDVFAYHNNAGNIAQITYEQLAALCGDDVSTWGARMQCEASGAWEVTSVKVGTKSNPIAAAGAVNFEGFVCKGDGWAQDGFDMPQEIIDALVPGSVVEVSYSSENGDMWLVMPDAAAGWMRVGNGDSDVFAVCDGSKCYVTYEQLASICGDDVSTWGARMQCEASGAWEVYGVKVGKAQEMAVLSQITNFEGFACKGDGWAQDGFDMPQEIIDALVPGSVVTISYSSENGDMWLVIPDAAAGWMRVGNGDGDVFAASNGSVCQITYEQLASICGDDVSTWGARMQCEASGAWEVYSVGVGTPAEE